MPLFLNDVKFFRAYYVLAKDFTVTAFVLKFLLHLYPTGEKLGLEVHDSFQQMGCQGFNADVT